MIVKIAFWKLAKGVFCGSRFHLSSLWMKFKITFKNRCLFLLLAVLRPFPWVNLIMGRFYIILLFMLATVLGANMARGDLITNGPRDVARVALTFDACPAHKMKVDWGVLDVIVNSNARATLLLSGKWMEAFPEETRRIAATNNFELGLHSYSHPHMTKLLESEIAEELKKNQEILVRLTGRSGVFFRPPFGEYNDAMIGVAAALGIRVLQYDLPSGDPSEGFSKGMLVKNVLKNAKNGSIVVMHMNGRGWRTAEALPEIIQGLRDIGIELVTVGELVGNRSPQ